MKIIQWIRFIFLLSLSLCCFAKVPPLLEPPRNFEKYRVKLKKQVSANDFSQHYSWERKSNVPLQLTTTDIVQKDIEFIQSRNLIIISETFPSRSFEYQTSNWLGDVHSVPLITTSKEYQNFEILENNLKIFDDTHKLILQLHYKLDPKTGAVLQLIDQKQKMNYIEGHRYHLNNSQ